VAAYRLCSRPNSEVLDTGGGGGMRAASIGISVWATTSEASIATTMGTATCTRKMDIWFFSPNTSGRKTMMVEQVPARVATPTSFTPAMVASNGRSGMSCRWRNTLS